ncbi:hypothetical protein [Roseovarius pelagicus]|uniref:Uncharacterized protein n=1 Tax=Roseovarius pelagicus TaxID=2980108 RepID=A0ABY6D9V2_9RHOB|nr:hypothetical protein [Roseovarius pelagicus]UXX82885.1 hypothetical protein N7U68_17635 [Roseovarius pelagicus]
MRILVAACFLGVMIAAGANAQQKANCAALSGPVSQASQGFSGMFISMQKLDYRKIGLEFTGKERAQFLKMAELQDRLLPVFEDYLFELETLGLMMSRCSR